MDRRRFWCGMAAVAAALTLVPSTAQAGHSPNLPSGGVNTHLTYFRTPYGDAELVAKAAKTAQAKLLRDSVAPYQNQGWYDRVYGAFRRVNEVSGARFLLTAVRADQSAADQVAAMAPLVDAGIVAGIEGANEWDNKGRTNWAAEVRKHQCDLHQAVKARWPRMAVVGPSLTQKYSGSFLGDLSHCMDIGNFHYYARHTGIDTGDLAVRWREAGVVAGWADGSGGIMIVTEANGIYGCNGPFAGSTEDTQRAGMEGLYRLLSQQAYGGAHRVIAYELLNDSSPSLAPCHSENNYGMFRQHSAGRWRAKPVFFPVRDANRRG